MEPVERDDLLTTEEYLRLPDDGTRYELVAGILVSEPPPFPQHGRIQARVTQVMSTFVEGRGLGVVLLESGFLLSRDPDTVRGPDVSFVTRDRYDAAQASNSYIRGAPDLAVEIVSSSNRPDAIHGKVADYLAAGARLVWVVDPRHCVVTVYRTLLSPRRIGADGVLDGEDVLPGLSLPVSSLFD
jgi:Uma2 family endonuclease